MSEPKLISPMLDNFVMGDPISDHDGVRCCPALEKDTDNRYIVKIISTPASQIQLDALLLSGAYPDKESALSYFKSLSDDIVKEAKILSKLSKLDGFTGFDGCQVEPMEENTGYDVYLLSKYKKTLQQHLRHCAPTHLEALNLGLDMCAALTVCRQSGYLYVDLKPGNIYMSPEQGYKIGDLGFISLNSLKYASLPDRYRSQYTAPEINDAYAQLNTTLDIYAVGLILYQVFNDGVLPFKDENAPDEVFPAPAYADYEMAEIILKACAPIPADRWQTPAEMGQALVSYMQRNGAHNTPITPVADVAEEEAPYDEEVEGNFEAAPSNDEADSSIQEESTSEEMDQETAPSEQRSDEVTEETVAPTDEAAPEIDDTSEEAEQEDVDAAEEPQEEIDESAIFTEDQDGNLKFLSDPNEDETTPNDAETVAYDEVTEEVSDMLQLADELIAHQAPDPVVQPDPIDVPVPPPLAVEEKAENAQDEQVDNISGEENADPTEETMREEVTAEEPTDEATEPLEETEEETEALTTEESKDSDNEEDEKPRNTALAWVRGIAITLVIAALIVAGFFFYKNYYLQPIDSIVLQENENGTLTVLVTSQIDESKLTVVCADTYGNQLRAPLHNGKATFTGLAPNSAYTVNVEITGFHRLTGDTTAAYTTPQQTEILHLNCVTGSEDGSIILSFSIDGPDSDQWCVSYTDDTGSIKESVFAGHTVTLTGFTVGNEYTLSIAPNEDLRITGVTQVVHTASRIVKANDLLVNGYTEGKLCISWSAPENAVVENWTVRCYNDQGFDETTVVDQCSAAFAVTDKSASYTIEVTAAGMSVNERVFAAADAVTVKLNAEELSSTSYKLTWDIVGSTFSPEGGWIIQYGINNTYSKEFKSDTNEVIISPMIPGAKCTFTLQAADGTNLLGNVKYHQTEDAQKFSGYAVSADKMIFKMCKTPSFSGWDRYDLSSSDYTTEFAVGQKASFLVQMLTSYNTSDDEITTLFVIKNENGDIIDVSSTTETWKRMWRKNYCELDIPSIPQTPGKYTISVYFNGAWAADVDFSVVN